MLGDPKINSVPTAYIKFLPLAKGLVGAKNKKTEFQGLLEWMMVSAPQIPISKAAAIDVSSQDEIIEQLRQEHEDKMKELQTMSVKQAEALNASLAAQKDCESKTADLVKQMQNAQAAAERREAEAAKALDRANAKAAARGGGLMGAFVDATTLISYPIAWAMEGDDEDFEHNWNVALGNVKKYCFI